MLPWRYPVSLPTEEINHDYAQRLFQVNPAKRQAFLSLLNTMVQESNKEAGCSFYQLWQCQSDENSYALIENWDDKAALSAHQKTPHWIAFNDVVNSYLTHDYDEHHYTEIAR
ncbi:antibiotic biosynthesis monooxygenase [Serratia ureilytica]